MFHARIALKMSPTFDLQATGVHPHKSGKLNGAQVSSRGRGYLDAMLMLTIDKFNHFLELSSLLILYFPHTLKKI